MSSALERDTLQVARDYVEFCLGIQRDPPSESARAMRHLAKQTERQQQATLHSLVQNFLDNHALDLLSSLQQVMAALVHDGQLNWGRVVALFAFIGMLAHRLSLQGDNIRRLAETIARYLSEEHREWLLQNGGWAGFLAFFHTARNMDSELSVRNVLFAAAGVSIAGIAALLNFKTSFEISVPVFFPLKTPCLGHAYSKRGL